MDDVAEFLNARLDEKAAAAARAQSLRDKLDDPHRQIAPDIRNGAEYAWQETAADPGRMLREVTAMRAILELAREATDLDKAVEKEYATAPRDLAVNPWHGDLIVRALAAIWSGHPDYRPEREPWPSGCLRVPGGQPAVPGAASSPM